MKTARSPVIHRKPRLRPYALAALITASLVAPVSAAAPRKLLELDFEPAHVHKPDITGLPPKKTMVIEKCEAAPRIDGLPDDECWRNAEETTDFTIPSPFTSLRCLYDSEAMYFLLHCETDPGVKPKAPRRPRDSSLASDDFVYLVFAPDDSGAECVFQINAAGSVYDARLGDDSWNPNWEYVASRKENAWYVEVAIPFAALGLREPPPAMGFNAGRIGPAITWRAWFNTLQNSAAASALRFEGVPPPRETKAETNARQSSPEIVSLGKALAVDLPRAYARPQDRWVDCTLTLSPEKPLEDCRVVCKLYPLGESVALAEESIAPPYDCGILSVDMREHSLSAAEVGIELYEGDKRTALTRFFLSARTAPNPLLEGPVAINLDAPGHSANDRAVPVSFGMPFPPGALWSADELRLVDKAGREIPSQTEVTALWAREGSIQWVRFDAVVDPAAGCGVEAARPAAEPANPVRLRERDGRWIMEAGAAAYAIERGPSPIAEVRLGNRTVASSAGARGLYVVDRNGVTARASAEDASLVVEAAGPVAACVRIEGYYRTAEGRPLARHITRIEGFAGQAFARVTHTLVLSEDTRETWFKEVGWEFAVAPGADPKAFFNTDRANPRRVSSFALKGDSSAWMLQDSHTRFESGADSVILSDGSVEQVLEDSECGDWAMLAGDSAGFVAACREAARQHPKEFEIARDRVVLKLFSDRAGEELDFRPPALIRRWNLEGEYLDKVKGSDLSAAGWSKTHELLLAPVSPSRAEHEAARLSSLNSQPVYAIADAAWIRDSDAMGSIHPIDRRNFPEAEDAIDLIFQQWGTRGHETGHYGFVDYFAGPTYHGGSGPCYRNTRYRLTYGLRSGVWLLYARSGDRKIREFAEGTNKAYLDNYLTHWPTAEKTRGLFTGTGGDPFSRLAMYWGKGNILNIRSSTDLNQFLWLYHISGYRRAKDAVDAFADGLKETWSAGDNDWRIIVVYRLLNQCYGFTWDPALRALAEGTLETFVDYQGEILLTKNRPYTSSTYKTQVDVRAFLEAWKLFGYPRHRELARTVSEYWVRYFAGSNPISYMNPVGVGGKFLYEETADPSIPLMMDYGLRRAGAQASGVDSSVITSFFEGLPHIMDILSRSPRKNPAWVAYGDYGTPTRVAIYKSRDGVLDLMVRDGDGGPGAEFELGPLGITETAGLELIHSTRWREGASTAKVPKDAPAGCYVVEPLSRGKHFVLAPANAPMVLVATNYWALPDIKPATPVYFKVPEDSSSPRIFCEGRAVFRTPDGEIFGDPDGMRGWIDLPPANAGLWSFEPLENRLVKTRNLPPFFAFGSPERYFEPPVEWEISERSDKASQATPAETVFAAVSPEASENLALNLSGKRTFRFNAGGERKDGDGGEFIPYKQGTIEFFLKPEWSTFDLGADSAVRRFVTVETDKDNWLLMHRVDPNGVSKHLAPKDPAHSMFGHMYLGDPKRSYLRTWHLQNIFERDEWYHVAWSWGPESYHTAHGVKTELMTMRIFINGRGTSFKIFNTAKGALADGVPRDLVINSVQGLVDELRVSDVQRYRRDFSPPEVSDRFRVDEHTRALFHFDGNLDGESYEASAELRGTAAP